MKHDWSKSKLVASLPSFEFQSLPALSEEAQKYCRHYHIDFSDQLPDVKQYMGCFDALGYRLVMHHYRPKSPVGTVFIFHGYFDHIGLYGHLIEYCLKRNLAVIAYDLPGHGLSSGRPTAIKSFEDYQTVLGACLALCEGQVTEPCHAIGQSTGGAVLIDHLLNRDPRQETSSFNHVVLLAPLVRPMGWNTALLLHTCVSPFVSTWKRAFSENSNDPSFIKFLKKHDPLQSKIMSIEWISALRRWIKRVENAEPIQTRVSIVQGRKDMTVDWRHNISIIQKKFLDVNVHYLPDGRHHLVNESLDIRTDAFEFIDGVLGLAP